MSMTDPLGDLLTRIRNGQQARKDSGGEELADRLLRLQEPEEVERSVEHAGLLREGFSRASVPLLAIQASISSVKANTDVPLPPGTRCSGRPWRARVSPSIHRGLASHGQPI